MNSSPFMDKQIMGLSGSQNNDIFDLLNNQDEQGTSKKDEILPNYDFHPIGVSRPVNSEENNGGGKRIWNSSDSKNNSSNIRNYCNLETSGTIKVNRDKDKDVYDPASILTEIDRTMKKHADNLLHAVEGVSARLSQLETRTRYLENSVDDLKISLGNSNGSIDGKLRQLENILREVQTGVQVIRDKQEIAETHMQLAKLQANKVEQSTENPSTQQTDTLSVQPSQLLPPSVVLPQQATIPSLPAPIPNAPPPQNPPPIPPPSQLPSTPMPPLPQNQYYPPALPTETLPHQQYQIPPPPQPVAPHPHYQGSPQLPQYPPPPPLAQQHQSLTPPNPPHIPPPAPHPEESSYTQSQPFLPNMHPTLPANQSPTGPPPSQQYYGPPMYEPPPNRPGQSLPFSYAPPGSSFSDPYPYGGSHSSYPGPSMKQSPQRLPSSQGLPHALPTATEVSSGTSSGGSGGNKIPIDDVVEKVATMGFSRDQVRATVRKLTENGQSVDLNIVLDKLMNGGEIQPQKGWFNR